MKEKIKRILKYILNTIIYTLLTIVVVCGLGLLFVFVTTKVSDSQGKTPIVSLFTIISPSMTPNINVYDVVVSLKVDPATLKAGDVITFYSDNPDLNGITVTHRIIMVTNNGGSYSFQTKGDFNQAPDTFIVPASNIVGKTIFKIPQLGRIQFFLASKGGWIVAILIPALAIISYDIYKIIKLILIKQKILSYKSEEDLNNKNNDLVTIDDIYKDELKTKKEKVINAHENIDKQLMESNKGSSYFPNEDKMDSSNKSIISNALNGDDIQSDTVNINRIDDELSNQESKDNSLNNIESESSNEINSNQVRDEIIEKEDIVKIDDIE